MFIKLNENNKIIASANFKVDETYIETDKKVVRAYDNKLYLEGEEPQQDLNVLKQEKLNQLKINCQNFIYNTYPIYKQLNIINPLLDYSQEDKETMNNFIDEQRSVYSLKESEINACTSKEELEEIVINFD